ncbi:MAG TPA: alpha/beta fold hydrolase [Candidatus Dormibacteraeota bacterium]|nr:alpha/beta fold hydrolase [Candidatus Dormibacteraeota bacterium]
MRELTLAANGLRFRCIADGPDDGPLVLLLHGFPEGAASWSAQLPALAAAGHLAVAPDLRGYGGTDCPEGDDAYRMLHLVADTAGLIDALGRERCHLAGHDWGALVGWAVASAHPDRLLTWSALSVGHPDAFTGAIRDDPDQHERSSYIDLFRAPGGKAERVLAEDGYRRLRRMYAYGPNPDAVPQPQVDEFVRSMARPGRLTAGLAYYRANLGEEAERDRPMAPDPITTPSQLIWGELDPAVGAATTRATERCVEGEYRLCGVSGAGHWLQFERPDEVSRLLLEWIGQH